MCRCNGANIDLLSENVMNKKIIILLLGCLFMSNAKAETTQEERVYILSTIWRNVRDNFAFPHHFEQANPDSLFKAFLPKAMNTGSDSEFELLITEFLAKFNDGHTRFFPKSPSPAVHDMFHVKFTGIGHKVYVKNIGKQYIRKIPVGSQLVSINGVPVQDFLEANVYPYISAPNADWKFRKSLESILNGADCAEVALEFLTPKGKMETLSLSRSEPQTSASCEWGVPEDARIAYVEKLKGDIAYMRMATFTEPEEVNKVFADNLPLFRNSKGVIFDIRGNRGGTDESWNPAVFDHIAPGDVNKDDAIIMKCRVANSAFQEFGSQHPQLKDFANETAMQELNTGSGYFSQVPDSLKIKCPVIILTDGYTGSAAEDFAATMKNLGLATLVGSHTVGVISHPRYFDLPDGNSYGISTWAYYNPDGTGIIETGILPDVEIEYSVDDLINGTDSQLDKAIEILKSY